MLLRFRTLPFLLFILLFSPHCMLDYGAAHFERLASQSGGASTEDRFSIAFDVSHYRGSGREPIPYELSDEDEIGLTDCGFDKDEDPAEDKYCILDLNEMDLLAVDDGDNDIPLIYNVPEEMCEYTSWYIPWHWNQPTGQGPPVLSKVTIEKQDNNNNNNNNNGNGDDQDNGDSGDCEFYRLGNSCVGRENLTAACVSGAYSSGPWTRPRDEQEVSDLFCDYDLSESSEGVLSNCCIGNYVLTDCDKPGKDPERTSWGGDTKSCTGGPLRVSEWDSYYNHRGHIPLPKPKVVPSWDRGLSDKFSVKKIQIYDASKARTPANMTTHISYSSVGVATYYDGIEDLQWGKDDGCSDCPNIFFSNKTNRALPGEPQLLGYPYFTLECLDSNFETTHRVHLIIREWNIKEEFLDFQDSNGRSGDPDTTGAEGEDCDYYEPDEFGDNQCNDLTDLDDLIDTIIPERDRLAPSKCQLYPCVDYGQAN